jgi:hypothetical protein
VRLALAAPTLLALAGCRIAESRAWNLGELHDESTHHRYTGDIESDMEYFWRHQIAGAFLVAGAHFEQKTPIGIPDPATTCLENLIALESYGDHDARIAGLQIEWASRLAAADPWKLTRERAVLFLGRAGKRLQIGMPQGLPPGSTPAGPDALGEALSGLVRASTPVLQKGDRTTPTQQLDLDSACKVVSGLTLDLDGARRMLHVAVDLAAAVGSGNKASAPLGALARDLEKLCVRLALTDALKDQEPLVRGAAVEAVVRCAGREVIDTILLQPAFKNEPSPDVLVRVVDLVREVGLPEGPIGGPDSGNTLTPEQSRRARLAAIYDLLDRPEGRVRTSAMRALEKVAGAGLHSLREEDWQAWWSSLPEARGP